MPSIGADSTSRRQNPALDVRDEESDGVCFTSTSGGAAVGSSGSQACIGRSSDVTGKSAVSGKGTSATSQTYLDRYFNLTEAFRPSALIGEGPFTSQRSGMGHILNLAGGSKEDPYQHIPHSTCIDIGDEDDDIFHGHAATFGVQRLGCRRNTLATLDLCSEWLNDDVFEFPEDTAEVGTNRRGARRVSEPALLAGTSRPQRQRRSSKTFTVLNYGQVGEDASQRKPSGAEEMTIVELGVDQDELLLPHLQDQQEQSVHPWPMAKRFVSITQVSPPLQKKQETRTKSKTSPEDFQTSETLSTHVAPSTSRPYDGSKRTVDKDMLAMLRRGQLYAKRKRDRLIQKDGSVNLAYSKVSKRTTRLLADPFITMLDMRWRWVWGIFCVAFLITWFGFALVWWLASHTNGDLDSTRSQDHAVCVTGISDFSGALLFSIETQHTIGYGSRVITGDCPISFIILIVQSLAGVIVECVMAGIVFAKLAKPKKRAETILFSQTAAVCVEDGHYCLVFRVGDMRRSQLVGCVLHAFLVRRWTTQEGREMPFHQRHLTVETESQEHDQFIFMAWPVRIVHRITRESPLWRVSADDLLAEQFEIIVVLEGTIESSGMTTQVRTSYLPSEILWGQRFESLLTARKDNGQIEIDYSHFDVTVAAQDMPDCSAEEYEKRESQGLAHKQDVMSWDVRL